ncbi:hypothetical protein ACWENO_03300 [Streptomyces sp. NPDC004436]
MGRLRQKEDCACLVPLIRMG